MKQSTAPYKLLTALSLVVVVVVALVALGGDREAVELASLASAKGNDDAGVKRGKTATAASGKPAAVKTADIAAIIKKAMKLQHEEKEWMVKGQLKRIGQSGFSQLNVGCDGANNSPPEAGFEVTSDEFSKAVGCGGTIPPSIIKKWRKQYEKRGGTLVPENSFFDSTNSQSWPAGGKGWNAANDDDDKVLDYGEKEDWVNPTRWVRQRRLEGRTAVQDDGKGHEYADGAWWPYAGGAGLVPQDQEAIRMSRQGDRGRRPSGWRAFVAGVKSRYDPSHSSYMERMYKRFKADRSQPMDDMHDAVESLDKIARSAGHLIDAANSYPIPRVGRVQRH